jgi:hypothetical protein
MHETQGPVGLHAAGPWMKLKGRWTSSPAADRGKRSILSFFYPALHETFRTFSSYSIDVFPPQLEVLDEILANSDANSDSESGRN